MSKFKFRAWYKPHLDEGVVEMFEQVEIDHELYFVSSKDKDVKYKFYIPFIDDDWIVEPWTELKDKDGQEIYVGDLVKEYWQKVPSAVVYNNGISGFYDPYGIFHYLYITSDLVSIIGNIHEGERK